MNSPTPGTAATTCPSCRHTFHAVDPDRCTHFGCPSCQTFFVDADDEPKRALRTFRDVPVVLPVLSPGSRGTLDGIDYVVAGVIGKCEQQNADSQWYEYMLFAGDGAAATLVEFDGHWMLVKPVGDWLRATPYKDGMQAVEYEGETVPYYHRYSVKVLFAAGGFDWDILEDERLRITEFAVPTRLLAQEEKDGIDTWYVGTHVAREAIATGFAVDPAALPETLGIGIIQPNPFAGARKPLLTIAIILVLLTGIAQLVLTLAHPDSTLVEGRFQTEAEPTAEGKLRPVATKPFHLQHTGEVEVKMRAALFNEWLEVTALLVNDVSGRVFEGTKSMESYSGYDDEGAWSEDNADQHIIFSSVPAGNYHLSFIPVADAARQAVFEAKVTRSNWVLSNFILLMVAIASVPVYYHLSYITFEQKRFL